MEMRECERGGECWLGRDLMGVGMRVGFVSVAAAAFGFFSVQDATAGVVVRVSKTRQLMYVYVDGELYNRWPVSTARGGYSTPSGVYQPTSFDAYHHSGRYNNSPMPYSIFFHGGYAIHGSYDWQHMGMPASHGCIRLDPENAAELFHLVRQSPDVRIVISQ